MKRILNILICTILTLSCFGCVQIDVVNEPSNTEIEIIEDGIYTTKEEVAYYIYTYDHLPDNYITKKEAQKLGWDSSLGNLWEVADGMSIGGDRFGNYEEVLPTNTKYHECDIDYEGGYRNAKRLVYGDDGSIYYTEDHYETFEELY